MSSGAMRAFFLAGSPSSSKPLAVDAPRPWPGVKPIFIIMARALFLGAVVVLASFIRASLIKLVRKPSSRASASACLREATVDLACERAAACRRRSA
jgi:hypothetical protein